jgi:hypothetical protein
MSNKLSNALDTDIYPDAEQTTLRIVDDFATALVLEAKRLAYQGKADVVLSSHIEEAYNVITSKRRENLLKQICQIIGGAFFGAFIQGFISELPKGNIIQISIYVILGFLGVGLFTWGLWK